MDFGLAKMLEAATLKKITDTHVDGAVGTPGYICPEQVRGEELDARSNLYSVGVLCYELLTGGLPFAKSSSMDMLLAHATELPPTFADLGLADSIPHGVEDVVQRCLAKDPADRPQSAAELAEAFDRGLREGVGEPAAPPEAYVPDDGDHALPPEKAFATDWVTPEDDPNAILFGLEAWMPEKIALVKLRGFVHDLHGDVVESVPGLVRVKLPFAGKRPSSGPLSLLGLGKLPRTEMELRLVQNDPHKENLLHITARFRPPHGTHPTDRVWRTRCVQTYINLRGYLM